LFVDPGEKEQTNEAAILAVILSSLKSLSVGEAAAYEAGRARGESAAVAEVQWLVAPVSDSDVSCQRALQPQWVVILSGIGPELRQRRRGEGIAGERRAVTPSADHLGGQPFPGIRSAGARFGHCRLGFQESIESGHVLVDPRKADKGALAREILPQAGRERLS